MHGGSGKEVCVKCLSQCESEVAASRRRVFCAVMRFYDVMLAAVVDFASHQNQSTFSENRMLSNRDFVACKIRC